MLSTMQTQTSGMVHFEPYPGDISAVSDASAAEKGNRPYRSASDHTFLRCALRGVGDWAADGPGDNHESGPQDRPSSGSANVLNSNSAAKTEVDPKTAPEAVPETACKDVPLVVPAIDSASDPPGADLGKPDDDVTVYIPVQLSQIGLSVRGLPLGAKSGPVHDTKTGRRMQIWPEGQHVSRFPTVRSDKEAHIAGKCNALNPGVASDVSEKAQPPQANSSSTTRQISPGKFPVHKTEWAPNGDISLRTKAPVLANGTDSSQLLSRITSSPSKRSRQAEPEPKESISLPGSVGKNYTQDPASEKAKGSSAEPRSSSLDHAPVPNIPSDSKTTRLGYKILRPIRRSRKMPLSNFVEPPPAAETNPSVNHDVVLHIRDVFDGKKLPPDQSLPTELTASILKFFQESVIDNVSNGVSNCLPEGYHEGLPVSIPDQSNPPPWEHAFSPATVNLPKPPAPTKISWSSNQDEFFDARSLQPLPPSESWAPKVDTSGDQTYLPRGTFAHPLSPEPNSATEKHSFTPLPNFPKLSACDLSFRGSVKIGRCSICARALDELHFSPWEPAELSEQHEYEQWNLKRTQTTSTDNTMHRARGPIFWSRRHRYRHDDPVVSSCANCSATWHRQCIEHQIQSEKGVGMKPKCPECRDRWH